MAHVITFSSLKGGVGKSTLSMNVAAYLALAKHRVLLVDTDPQGTCVAWSACAADAGRDQPSPVVVAMPGSVLRRDLPTIAKGFDVVVVDSPPRLGLEARSAMLVADVVLIPVTPGAADVWAAKETVMVLEDAKGLRPDLRAAVILNRADRTTFTRHAAKAIEALGVLPMDVSVGQRVAFREATLEGQGVTGYAPKSDAAHEIRRLTRSIFDVIGGASA